MPRPDGDRNALKSASLPDSFRADNLYPQAKGYDIRGGAVSAEVAALMKWQQGVRFLAITR